MKYETLNNGVKMPAIGFGVYQIRDLQLCERCVSDAISVGYRLIDTAQAYGNERAVGNAVKQSGIPRKEFFITTKIWITNAGAGKTRRSLEQSLKDLGTGYADLVLIHHPYSDYYAAYRELEQAYEEGLARAIGVSNFYMDRYIDLCNFARVIPAVNQLETHVFRQRFEDRAVMDRFGTKTEAWAPLAEGKRDLFSHPLLSRIGRQYGKTPAQVALRYLLENEVTVIPKTTRIERMRENLDILDFGLSETDREEIQALDTKKNLLAHHHSAEFTTFLINAAKEREAKEHGEK